MFKLFSGSANTKLSAEIAKSIGLPLAKAEIVRFGNSEVKVTIQEEVRNQACLVIQPTSNPTDTNLMELLFFCDALRREEAKKVIAYIPYFGYAKQDIQHRAGECISVNVVIRMLESIGFYKVYAIDLHDEATSGVFSIPFKNLSAMPLLAKYLKKYLQGKNIDLNQTCVVSPDQGAVERVRNFGEVFYGDTDFPEVVIEKKRDQNIIHKAKPIALYGDVAGKIAIIVDDMVVSGSTLIPAVNLCLQKGATKVYAVIVHHDFTQNAPEILQNSKLERFFTTNSIHLKPEQKFAKLEEVSIAPLIAEDLKLHI